jgi:restriction system protein
MTSAAKQRTSLLDAVHAELVTADTPLTVAELTARLLASGAWSTNGKTPEATVASRLAVDVKQRAEDSRFIRIAPNTYGLRTWPAAKFEAAKPAGAMTYLDAAEKVLELATSRDPMHYRAITDLAIARGFLTTDGLTPAQTMYVQLMTDVKRRHQRADEPRFTQLPKGYFGLAKWAKTGLEAEIARHNREVKEDLLQRLRKMDPHEFEKLVGTLLSAIGFEQVVVTKRSKDGGIDVRGTFVSNDVIRTAMAVQVKRWERNVRAPDVQNLRGALDPHERGLLITTSGYEKGARTEAELPNRQPIALMGGEKLVDLLIEHQIGVQRGNPDLLNPVDFAVDPEG